MKADAELIVALQNAAYEINPDNPMAVAKNLKQAFRLLHQLYSEKCMRDLEGGDIPFEWAISEKTMTTLRTLLFDTGLRC